MKDFKTKIEKLKKTALANAYVKRTTELNENSTNIELFRTLNCLTRETYLKEIADSLMIEIVLEVMEQMESFQVMKIINEL